MATVSRGIALEITSQLDERAAQTIAHWIGCFGVVWNCKVAENKEAYRRFLEKKGTDPEAMRPSIQRKVAHFQTEDRPWLRVVPSQIRRTAADKWYEAIQAAFQGLRSFPRFRSAASKKNCYVTRELFEVVETETRIRIGLKERPSRKPFCWLSFEKGDRNLRPPKSLWLRRRGARFWISWSYEREGNVAAPQEVVDQVARLSPEAQNEAVVGADVGVAVPVALSTGGTYAFADDEARAMRRHDKRIRHLNKASARKRRAALREKRKTGANYRKTKQALGDRHAGKANLRKNAAHRISKRLADKPATKIVVAEKLAIRNMVRKPKAKKDPETGRWARNGRSAKRGLNRAILNIGWGSILDKLEYKLAERGKLLLRLDPKYSSQECSICGHVAAENRKTQASFVCVGCGYQDNADINAAKVLKGRFLRALRAGTFVLPTKTAKTIAPRRKQAARTAVSLGSAQPACGADVSPLIESGGGCEAGSRTRKRRQAEVTLGSSLL